MKDKYVPETYVGKYYAVIIINNEAHKIAIEHDEDEINLEVEYMNEARNSGIPVPKVIEITNKGMIMEKAKGELAAEVWNKFDINKKKTFIISLIDNIKKLPKKGNSYLVHKDLDLQNIFVNDDGEITSIIDWKDCEYLPEFYIRQLPNFLCEGNHLNSEDDTNILSDIFYKQMGKLSNLEQLVIKLHDTSGFGKPGFLEYMKDLSERFYDAVSDVTVT